MPITRVKANTVSEALPSSAVDEWLEGQTAAYSGSVSNVRDGNPQLEICLYVGEACKVRLFQRRYVDEAKTIVEWSEHTPGGVDVTVSALLPGIGYSLQYTLKDGVCGFIVHTSVAATFTADIS